MADGSNTDVPADGWVSIMGTTGLIARAFIYGLNRTKVEGLENLTNLLDSRKENPEAVEHGLITGRFFPMAIGAIMIRALC